MQTALKMVLEPIFEWEFVPTSFGFRPGQGCKDALRRVEGLMRAGYTWVIDADDFVIMCRSQQEAKAALAGVSALVGERGLSLHADKTSVVATHEVGQGFDFLGYHFENGTRWPRKKSLKKFKDAIRRKTRRSNGRNIAAIIRNVNRTSIGWFGYFKHSNWKTFAPLDGWIRRRLRSILRKYGKKKGIARGRDNIRWPNQYFRDLGYFSLYDAHQALLQSSRG